MARTQQVIYNLVIIGAILSFGIVFCTYSRIFALDVLDEDNSQFKVELHVPAVEMEETKTEEVAAVAEAVSANEAAEDEAAHTNQDRHELSPKFGEYATDKSLELTLTPLQERAREIFLQNATVTPPPNRLGAFVHVGKAGGSTLSALLKFGCHSFALQKCDGRNLPNETAVSKLVTYYHTPDFMNKKLYHSQHEFYLFSLRDPMARAISVYCYEHPYNTYVEQNPEEYANLLTNFSSSEAVFTYKRERWKNMPTRRFPKQRKINNYLKLYDCFPDLETYANLLDNVDNFTSGEWEGFAEKGDCENVAKLTMHHGAPSAIQHQHWDLSLIINGGDRDYLANKTVLVVRTEHQNDDWVGANQYLGQEGTISEPTHKLRDSSAIDFPIKKDLSEEGRKKLCMALNGEYKIYLNVLAEAVNLSLGDKYDSLQQSRTNCPWLNLTLPDGIDEVKT